MSATFIRKNHLSGNKDYVWFYEKPTGWIVNIGQNNNTNLIKIWIEKMQNGTLPPAIALLLSQFHDDGEWSENEDEEIN